jgi:hypothetical protein
MARTLSSKPVETKTITCDAAPLLEKLAFPSANSRLMLPKRTFWEKATAVHVYCANGDVGDHHSRHWHDLVRLDEAGEAGKAFAAPLPKKLPSSNRVSSGRATAMALRQFGTMPLSVSSLIAFSFFDRCASPMPRSTFGALVNWMLS